MSKGSNIRPYDRDKFKQNFERIFGQDISDVLEEEAEHVPRETGQKPVVEGDDAEQDT